MAIKSMTGFGEGAAMADEIRVSVELSSVNRKQLDVNINLPRDLAMLDPIVQRMARAAFSRGRVSGAVRIESETGSAGKVTMNDELAAQYVAGLRASAEKLGLAGEIGVESLIRLPGVVSVEAETLDLEKISGVLEEGLSKALDRLAKMRSIEGAALEKDLRERLALLESFVEKIRVHAPSVVVAYREKLFQRLETAGLTDLASDERIVKEIALFADRCDISEELTRLDSHLAQAYELLGSDEPVGRTLDFLCQELFREINTVGSKANGVELTRHVVAVKTELERIREQVQNVE